MEINSTKTVPIDSAKGGTMKRTTNIIAFIGIALLLLPSGDAIGQVDDASVAPLTNSVSLTPTGEGAMVDLTLETAGDVSVSVLQGDQLVGILHRGSLSPGPHQMVWKDRNPNRSGPFVLTVKLKGAPFYEEGFMKEAGGSLQEER